MTRLRPLVLAVLAAVVLASCSSGSEFGSSELLEFDEKGTSGAIRDGSSKPKPDRTKEPDAQKTAEPSPSPTQAKVTYYDITLVSDSPYFEPGELLVPAGSTIRVTNQDRTPERPTRTFTASDGSFDSGPIKPGKRWERLFDEPGTWQIVDQKAGFIFITLEVY